MEDCDDSEENAEEILFKSKAERKRVEIEISKDHTQMRIKVGGYQDSSN